MQKRFVVLVATAVVVLAGAAVVGAAAIPALLHTDQPPESPAASMNTAPQKSPGNSGAFVDVTDNPVSLPTERKISPPRTGNAGLVSGREPVPAVALSIFAAALLVSGARAATRSRTLQ